MIQYAKKIIQRFFKEGHERSVNIRKNVLFSILLKGASIPVTLLLVPMTINYINPVQFGIWLTISSVIGWMNFFDIGMGLGLRNKLAHSLALNEYANINKYISTTYAALAIISFTFFIVFYFISYFFDWNKLLNIPSSLTYSIRPLVLFVLVCFCIQFVIQILNTLLNATHQPSRSSFITFAGQLATLIIMYFLTKNTSGNMFALVSVLAGVPIIIMFISGLYLFKTSLNGFAPKLKNVDFKFAKDLINTGGAFFLIQLGVLVLFQTDNIIITRILGPGAVTTFNVSYKLFSLLIMFFTIILTPYWSAFTEAYAKKDYAWIRNSIKKLRELWLVLSAVAIVLFFISPPVYKIWIGDSVVIPVSLSLAMAIYAVALMWQTLHIYLLNGIGKIRLQLILFSIGSLVNIPLAVWLGKKFGIAGIISANTLLFIVMGIIFSIQCEKIINRTATRLWDK
ncbi:MAG TPA: oligosaccharide flippase family protein [Chitinophagaceae bacterium]|nr:oligosaccharide flippase family protein [Chitinophagaceae bacterium]